MTDHRADRVRQIQEELADLKVVIKELEAERSELLCDLMADGVRDLGDGYKINKQERYEYDTSLARRTIPTIYEALVQRLRDCYNPEPTKTELEEAIAHLPEDQRKAIIESIRLGEPKVTYAVRRG
jgi:DNA-directed RNA polymerase specialized sigma24 family protein